MGPWYGPVACLNTSEVLAPALYLDSHGVVRDSSLGTHVRGP